jgi:hypothetical protein
VVHQGFREPKPTTFASLDVASTSWHAAMHTADCGSLGVFDVRIWIASYNRSTERASEQSGRKKQHRIELHMHNWHYEMGLTLNIGNKNNTLSEYTSLL